MKLTRRRLLSASALLVTMGGLGAGSSRVRAEGTPVRAEGASKRIRLRNLHTDEELDVEFSSGGDVVAESMARIQRVLRDFRTGEEHAIDPGLIDHIHGLAQSLSVDPVFDVISGFRSPETNERLRSEGGGGVAKHSLHMQGRAIDVRLGGVACAALSERACELACGGVGYYRTSNFVHLDTGAVRTWRG
jgi:uncharacterized protein YcbK (DUF882 family)